MSMPGHSCWRKHVLPLVPALVAIILAGCSSTPQAKRVTDLLTPVAVPVSAVVNQLPPSAPDVVNGGLIYGARCLACHGESGQGNGPQAATVRTQGGQVAKLVDSPASQSATPTEWFDVVSNGRLDKLMPAFAQTLTPQDRWDVLSYIWAMDVTAHALPTLQGIYTDACLSCHGAAGKGDGRDAGASGLQSFADHAWLVRHSLLDISDAMISGTIHTKVTLDEPQRLALAGYVRSFGYRYSDPVPSTRSAYTGDGIVRVQAMNRTPQGGPVVGLPVALHTYNATGEVFSRTATVNPNGIVTFDALPREPSLFYQAELIYSGARFFSPPMQFSTTQQISDSLAVFEVTNDPGVISVSTFHFFVQDIGEGFINVMEFYAFTNMSDRAYINRLSTDRQLRSLQVSLPADATDVTFDGPGLGNRFFQDGLTIYDSDAVPPGQQAATIAMNYNLPYRGSREISREIAYPIQNWDVLLPDNELRISNMRDNGLQPFHTGNIRFYVPEQIGLPAGGALTFQLAGQPRTLQVAGNNSSTVIVAVLLLASLALAAVILVNRWRLARTVVLDLSDERQSLLRQIADLDTRYSAGMIRESDYRETRIELKESLLDIWE